MTTFPPGWAVRTLCVVAIGAGLLISPARTARADVTAGQVKIAIDKAIDFVRKNQAADGSWQEFGRQGGSTALNALALLNAGVPESDPAVSKAIANLTKIPNRETYVVALKAMVYRYADAVKYKAELTDCAKWLIDAQLGTGTWTYNKMPAAQAAKFANMIGDNSNTQFALLGLHEAALGGVDVPKEVWKRSEDHFLKSQLTDGGWHYRSDLNRGLKGYGSMTCAGIASLYITGNQLDVSQETGWSDGVAHNCGQYRQNDALNKGLQWMARNFTTDTNPGNGGAAWRMYYLYAMERVGMISGLKFFGTHDWYREGAEALVNVQRDNGSFPSAPYDSSLALLFLAKGNKPVLVNKLQWGEGSDWSPDRSDVDHLVSYVNSAKNEDGRKFSEQPAGWQVVTLRAPLVDLLDAPILYFNGHTFPKFTDDERKKVREFVEQGGTILAEACCSKPEFTTGFRDFVKQTWPEYAIDKLADDHPIFNSFYKINKNAWGLEGVQVGCRTGVIFAPKDMSCLWEQRDPKLKETSAAFMLGANIAAYATGLERLKDKLERARVAEKEDAGAKPGDIVRGALHIAVLAHGDNQMENMTDPNALPKFAEFLRDRAKIDVVTRLTIIDPRDVELLNHPIMYMTGHHGFKYSDEQIKAIRTWLDRGGFLLASACCGRDATLFSLPGDPALTNDFGTSFRALVAALYKDTPDVKLTPLPADHPIRGSAKGFFPITQVSYRPEYEKKLSAAGLSTTELKLESVIVNGRLAIVYSPCDLTCGLEDHKCFGCRGLIPKDAYKVATNVILYELSH
jgi:hypothetical protein